MSSTIYIRLQNANLQINISRDTFTYYKMQMSGAQQKKNAEADAQVGCPISLNEGLRKVPLSTECLARTVP